MKILLLSDLPPCINHTGGLFLDRLCTYLIESGCEIVAYIVKNDEVYTVLPEDKKQSIKFKFDRKPRENVGHTKGPVASLVFDRFTNITYIPKLEKRILDFINTEKPDLIWGVIQGQTMTKIVRPIAKKSNIKYIIQFYDAISWWFQANRIDKLTQKKVMKEYAKMLHNSYCFIGASEEMANDYALKYDINRSVGIMMPFDKGNAYSEKIERNDNDFVIAISGQLYARSTIAALTEALTQLKWQYNGKRIVFRIYGPEIVFYGLQDAHVEYRGWIDQKQLLQELNTADLLYCPYRFDEHFKEVASYSFPGKLSTYMKTGVPLVVHAPEYSSIASFIKKYECGYLIETVNVETIKKEIEKIISDNKKDALVVRANEVANEVLSDEITKRKILYAVGLRESVK
ncbi:MAG: glycosyltransferase family 4 protein [Pseudobutyrivibrio ruminis]|uniref:Glycosyltransferase family 4 protein n=1 Tax=Pseudobutyrivibrio ruminis TaxID=46206 RepID=A0A927U584_9FIRM|nr:glycosyltransferase family 4 protein [Pseudobutyrivibrio ruminis]